MWYFLVVRRVRLNDIIISQAGWQKGEGELLREKNPIIQYRGSSIDVELLLRKHKRTEKIGKNPVFVWNYQKLWTLFLSLLLCLRELCFAPNPGWFKQVRQFYWYWDEKLDIIELLCDAHGEREERAQRISSLSIFRPFPTRSSSLGMSRSIRTIVHSLAPFSEKNLNEI
jgi:hypothetical protein